jgi:protein kinase-like protein
VDDPLEQSLEPLTPSSQSDGGRDLLPQQLFTSSERAAQQVGEFWIRAHLGTGAMGQVFLVEHMSTSGMYALKLLPEEMVSDEESLTRFAREAEALKILGEHPAIVTVYGTGRTKGGAPYYIMDYVEGRTLKEAFKQGMDLEAGLDVIDQIAHALAFAHSRNLIHRDLKPENVLLNLEGQARLVDFGLVRAITQGGDAARLTQAGQALGTPAYMAPEQTSSEEAGIGPWTDVWGLGVLAYETCTQRTPYQGTTPLEIYTQLYEGSAIQTPRALGAKVKAKLEAVIMKALAHKGSERFPDAGAFLEALRAARQTRKPVESAGAPSSSGKKRGLLLASLAILSVILLGGALFYAQDMVKARKSGEAALSKADALLKQGDLEGAAAELQRAASAASDAKLKDRYAELQATLAQRQKAASAARAELEALFAKGEVAAARACYLPGVTSENTPWVLALTGDYAEALTLCPKTTSPAILARLAAWAGDQDAAAAALGAVGGPQSLALAWELRAFLPQLPLPKVELPKEDPWRSVALVEAALAQGDLASALLELGEEPADEAPRAAWRLARGRLAVALGDRDQISAAGAAIEVGEGLHPLDRGRSLAWRAFLARLAAEPEGAAEVASFAPGVPLAKALRGEASPWWGGASAARVALAAGDQAAARAALEAAGASRSELARSPLEGLRALAARGRDGAHGLLTTRVRALAESSAMGATVQARALAEPLVEVALRLRPDEPLALWIEADLARARGREVQVSAEAVLGVAPEDVAARLLVARAQAAQDEKTYLTWLSAHVEGDQAPYQPSPSVVEASLTASTERGPLARVARLEELELIGRWLSSAAPDARAALQARGLALSKELLGQVDLAPILAARGALAQALRAGDLAAAREAVEQLAAAKTKAPADAPRALRLRSLLGDPGAPDAARAYLALAGELPAFVELRARVAREKSDRAELDQLASWVPDHARVLLGRELTGLNPTSAQPLAGSAESLLNLAEAILAGPEHTRLVVGLLRSRGEFLGSIKPESLSAPGRPLLTHLSRGLLLAARIQPGDVRSLPQGREALRTLSAAACVAPANPTVHLLRLEVANALPAWARKKLQPELALSQACARGALPWAAAPLLSELAAKEKGDARREIDELLAQGFVSRPDLVKAVFGRAPLQLHQAEAASALEGISGQLKPLKLRHDAPERVAMSAYELSVRAYTAKLPLCSLSLRLRTGADVAFDFASVQTFEASLSATLPKQPGQRARIMAEYQHWLARQIAADPELSELDEDEKAKQEVAKAKLWSQRAAQSLLQGLADRPLGERLRFSEFMGLGYRGPLEPIEEATEILTAALGGNVPESRELWASWVRRWDPTPIVAIFHEALEARGKPAPFSPEDLGRPFGFSQALLWGAQRPVIDVGLRHLATKSHTDELTLLFLRGAAFTRTRTPAETFFWNVNPTFRLSGEGLNAERATLARDLFRAAQVLTRRPKFFAACEGDALVDLAAAAEGEARTALAAKALERVQASAPALAPPHLESQTSAWWRLARAKAIAGDTAGAEEALGKMRSQHWRDWWGLDQSLGADPATEVLREVLPAANSLFDRYAGGGAGDGDGDGDGDEEDE